MWCDYEFSNFDGEKFVSWQFFNNHKKLWKKKYTKNCKVRRWFKKENKNKIQQSRTAINLSARCVKHLTRREKLTSFLTVREFRESLDPKKIILEILPRTFRTCPEFFIIQSLIKWNIFLSCSWHDLLRLSKILWSFTSFRI